MTFYLRNLQSRLAENRQPAEEAIRHLGPKCLPLLCKMIQAKDSPSKQKTIAWINKHTFLKIHYPSFDLYDRVEIQGTKVPWNEKYVAADGELHERAKTAFRLLGPVAKPVLPELVKAFHQRYSSPCAGSALFCLGEDGIGELLSALRSLQAWLRMSAAGAFDEPNLPEEYIPALLESLNDSDYTVRFTAANSLRRVNGKSPELVIPALVNRLRDPFPAVRQFAILSLC